MSLNGGIGPKPAAERSRSRRQMEPLSVECLRCGMPWAVQIDGGDHLHPDECPRCGYLGWAHSNDLTESVRRRIREQPPERRVSLYPV
jgi:hypothetical protein